MKVHYDTIASTYDKGRADGKHLSFAARTFDCCLMSMVIHHLQNKQAALDDVFRVLKPGGICLIRTVSHDQLRSVLDYRFFPRALPIDLDRIPDVPVIEDMLRRSDFSWVHTHTVISPLAESAEEYLTKIRHKHSSTLRLLSEDEY